MYNRRVKFGLKIPNYFGKNVSKNPGGLTHTVYVICYGVVVVWLSGYIVGLISEVTQHLAGLVLRWVTVRRHTISVFNQTTQANSAWPSLRG